MKHLLTIFLFFAVLYLQNFSSAQSLCFDPANDNRYETYGQCHDLGVLDFNDDGHLDVFVAGDALVSVHIGNGDGTFQPFTTTPPGTNNDLELFDFEGDGDLDMWSYGSGNLVAGKNNGDGTMEWFAYLGVTLLGNNFSEMSTGDVTGDGYRDAVVNDYGDNKLYVFEGDATGAPVSSFSIDTPYLPGNVKVGDLNGDDFMDIVCSYSDNDNVSVFFSNGNGTFDEILIDAGPHVPSGLGSVEIADLNDDTYNEVLVAGAAQMFVLMNNGNETFDPAFDVFTGSYCLGFETGDWDNDDDIDIVWANDNTGGVTIVLNNGDGTFPISGNEFYSSNGDGQEVAVGDFNEDGIADLVVANGFGYNFAYLVGHGDGTFGSRTLLAGYGAAGLAVADFNNDGYPDVVASNQGSFDSAVLAISLNNGDGSFADTEFIPNVNNAGECVAGYFNADNFADIAAHSSSGYAVHLGNGDGTFDDYVLYPTGNMGEGGDRTCTRGDFNNDGDVDLAGSRPGADAVSVVFGNGDGSFNAPVILSGAGYPRTLMAEDFNNDNNDDLIVCSNTTDEVWIYFSNGNGTFSSPLILDTPGNPEGLTAFDADEDNIVDLVVGSPNANVLYTFISNNNGTFDAATETDIPSGSNVTRLAHADVNGDGYDDILGALYQTDAVGVFFGNGDGTFESAISYGVDQAPSQIEVADFNQDGTMDFSTLNSGVFNVSVVLNNAAFINANGELAFCEGEDVILTATEGYSYEWNTGATTQSITVSENGEFYCSITNQAGDCTLITPTVEVEVFTGQTVSLDLDSTQVCINDGSFFLSGGFPFGGQYTGTGITANVFDPAVSGVGTFTITYTFEDTGECTSGSATDEIEVELCDLVEMNDTPQIRIYPNITSDFFNVEFAGEYNLTVHDVLGKMIFQQQQLNGKTQVDMVSRTPGVYLVTISTSNGYYTTKVEKAQ